jgi:hypothetical protein
MLYLIADANVYKKNHAEKEVSARPQKVFPDVRMRGQRTDCSALRNGEMLPMRALLIVEIPLLWQY